MDLSSTRGTIPMWSSSPLFRTKPLGRQAGTAGLPSFEDQPWAFRRNWSFGSPGGREVRFIARLPLSHPGSEARPTDPTFMGRPCRDGQVCPPGASGNQGWSAVGKEETMAEYSSLGAATDGSEKPRRKEECLGWGSGEPY